jgi:hypothetical protein
MTSGAKTAELGVIQRFGFHSQIPRQMCFMMSRHARRAINYATLELFLEAAWRFGSES